MTAVDPTYPLYPVACILGSTLLLLTLSTSFARQSWNLGVVFLCFWLFWQNLTAAINAIIWADNRDVKLYVYCDIVTHLNVIAYVVKPMCTLIIVRRLHLIASLRSVELPTLREKRNNLIVEWVLGLVIPLLVAGPCYYAVQGLRFEVAEGFGCKSATDGSILTQLLIDSWTLVVPLISIFVYYPKVAWVFYRQHRDTNRFLHSNNSISRTNYFRILALASVDILCTLPTGIASIAIKNAVISNYHGGHVPFYNGWNVVHGSWGPKGISYAVLKSQGAATLSEYYFSQWTSPILSFIVFGLFGLTGEARAAYWHTICLVGEWSGWTPTSETSGELPRSDEVEFSEHQVKLSFDLELGSLPSSTRFDRVILAKPNGDNKLDKAVQELCMPDGSCHAESPSNLCKSPVMVK